MKKLSILLLILLSFGLLSCEMTVNQDESALVMELDALDTAIDELGELLSGEIDAVEVKLEAINTLIADLEGATEADIARIDALILGLKGEYTLQAKGPWYNRTYYIVI